MTVSGTKNFTLTSAPASGFGIRDKTTDAYTGVTTVAGSKVLTLIDTAGLTPGMTITGVNIDAGSVIDTVDDATHVTLTKNALLDGTTSIVGSTKPSLTKLGTGTLTLNAGDNTYSGPTFLTSGTIVVGANSTIDGLSGPFGQSVINLNGGVLKDNGSAIQIYNNVVIGGDVTFDSTNSTTGSLSFTDFAQLPLPVTFALGTTSILTVKNTTYLNLGVTGAGKGFTKAGSGELVLASSANTYTGLTTVNAGKLNIAGNMPSGNSLTVGASGTADFTNTSTTLALGTVANSGVVNFNAASQVATLTGSANGVVNLVGANVKVLNGNYNGRIRGSGKVTKDGVGSDNLVLVNNASDFSGGLDLNAGAISFSASTVLDSGSILSGPLGVGEIAVGSGGGALSTSFGAQILHNKFTLNGDLAVSGTGLTISDAGLLSPNTITLGAATSVTFNASASLTLDQVVGGSANLIKTGSGVLTLSKTNNAYSGVTTVNNGVLAVTRLADNADSLGAFSALPAGLSINNNATLRYIGAGNSTTGRLFTVGVGGATFENIGTGTLVMNGTGAMAWGGSASARTITLTGTNAGANAIAALISDSGSGANITSISKTGGGTWGLTAAASTFSGNISITGGVLQVATLANGGFASSLGKSALAATSLTMNGGVLEWIGTTSQTSDRLFRVDNGGGGLSASGSAGAVLTLNNIGLIRPVSTSTDTTISIGGSGGTVTSPNILAGQFSDNSAAVLTLAKNGTGVWKLTSSASNFTGKLLLNGGKIVVDTLTNGGVAGPLGVASASPGNIVFGGGGLVYTGGGVTTDRMFSLAPGNSSIESSGTGALSFSGSTSSMSGATTVARSLTLGGTLVGFDNLMSLSLIHI